MLLVQHYEKRKKVRVRIRYLSQQQKRKIFALQNISSHPHSFNITSCKHFCSVNSKITEYNSTLGGSNYTMHHYLQEPKVKNVLTTSYVTLVLKAMECIAFYKVPSVAFRISRSLIKLLRNVMPLPKVMLSFQCSTLML